jgi:hypothetical protein
LSQHRKIQFSRSKAVALLAVGTFSVATAASAAAATWPQGPPRPAAVGGPDAGRGAHVILTDRLTPAIAAAQDNVSEVLRGYQVRDAGAELADAHWKAAHDQAARKAAVRPAATASSSPQQIAEAMLGSFGWSSSQFSCLNSLWEHESGWSVTAYNAGTGAYGIPQALPGSKMASAGPDWQNDATTQIRWGLRYIQATYGSPCAAWDHELATGWY